MRRTQRRSRHTRHTKRTKKVAWGYHLSVDARGCDHAAISSKEAIRAFVVDLVKAIDMVAYGAPRIVRFGADNKMGYTLVQLIETSDITCHFCEETNASYLDVFSCKAFDKKDALKVFTQHFHPQGMKIRMVKRTA